MNRPSSGPLSERPTGLVSERRTHDLCSYPAGTELQPGRDIVDRQWAALEKADDAPTARVE